MRLLLVEDDPMLAAATTAGLRQDGHAVDWVGDVDAGRAAVQLVAYDSVVLDLGLPRVPGLELLKWMRGRGMSTPVIIVTARDAVEDRIQGLDAGADDYVVKPFDLDELAARLRAIERRVNARIDSRIRVGDVLIDLARKEVVRGDQRIDLTAREFALVEVLVQMPGRLVPRVALEERLYGFGEEVSSNTVEVFIHHLRRKLGDGFIVNVRGRGYRVADPD